MLNVAGNNAANTAVSTSSTESTSENNEILPLKVILQLNLVVDSTCKSCKENVTSEKADYRSVSSSSFENLLLEKISKLKSLSARRDTSSGTRITSPSFLTRSLRYESYWLRSELSLCAKPFCLGSSYGVASVELEIIDISEFYHWAICMQNA